MTAVFKREFKSYFQSMIGYVFIAFMTFLVNIYFSMYSLNAATPLLRNTLSAVSFVFFIIIPVLSMRIMAEERRQKTDQLLYTAPVKILDIVLGKYMAMVTVLLIPIGIFAFYPLIMGLYGKSSSTYAMDYVALFGFFLMGALYLSVGLFLSAMTESQVIAAVTTFAALMISHFIGGLLFLIPGSGVASLIGFSVLAIILAFVIYMMTKNVIVAGISVCVMEVVMVILYLVNSTWFEGGFAKLFGVLDCVSKQSNFLYGMLDMENVLYYVSGCVLFVFLTVQAVQKRRYS